MPPINHVHTYIRIPASSKRYKCADPDCSHTDLRNSIVGRRSKCSYCGNEFIVSMSSVKLAKPHCSKCVRVTPQNKHLYPDVELGQWMHANDQTVASDGMKPVNNLTDVLEELGL